MHGLAKNEQKQIARCAASTTVVNESQENKSLNKGSLVLHQILEGRLHFIVQSGESLLVMLLGLTRHLKLHVRYLPNQALRRRCNRIPTDFRIARALGDYLLSCLMEANNDLHPH